MTGDLMKRLDDVSSEVRALFEEVRRIIKQHIDLASYKLPYMPRLPLDLMFDSDQEIEDAADL